MDINITPQTVYSHLLNPFNSEIENLQIDITEEKTKHIAVAVFVIVGAFFLAVAAGSTPGLLFSVALGVISLYFTTAMSKIGIYLNRIEASVKKANVFPRPSTEISPIPAHIQIPKPGKLSSLPELRKEIPKEMPKEETKAASPEKKTVIIQAQTETEKAESTPKLAPRVTMKLISETKYKEELRKEADINREIDGQGNTLLHYAKLFNDKNAIKQIEGTPGINLNPENKLKETPENFVKKHLRTDTQIIKPIEVHAPAQPQEPVLPISKKDLISEDAIHQAFNESKSANYVLEEKYGNTLLHYAALYMCSNTEFAAMYDRLKEELDNAGLDEIKNKLGQTPDEFAKIYKRYL